MFAPYFAWSDVPMNPELVDFGACHVSSPAHWLVCIPIGLSSPLCFKASNPPCIIKILWICSDLDLEFKRLKEYVLQKAGKIQLWVRLHSHWSMSFKPTEISGTKTSKHTKSKWTLISLKKNDLWYQIHRKIGNSQILRSLLPAPYHSAFKISKLNYNSAAFSCPGRTKSCKISITLELPNSKDASHKPGWYIF